MSFRTFYARYVDFFSKKIPVHRWAVPVITIDILLIILAIIFHNTIGDNFITVTIAIIGCGSFGTIMYMVKTPWRKEPWQKENDDADDR